MGEKTGIVKSKNGLRRLVCKRPPFLSVLKKRHLRWEGGR